MFMNMDETAVLFESKLKSTTHRREDNTVSVYFPGRNNRRDTLCFSIASDGRKLPLLIFFQGQPSEEFVEYSFLEHAWVLSAQRMYGRSYYKNLEWLHWNPYMSDYGYFVFLLDDFSCHAQPPFLDLMKTYGTYVELTSGGFTCVLQPCGVGVMKSWKGSIRKYCLDWVSSKRGNLNSNQRLLDAERK